jgi:hypothetical protein
VIARAIVVVALAGCGSIVGIDDHVPLTCHSLSVIRDDGRELDVTPPFETSVTSYHVIVSSLTIAVQLVMACDDPAATLTADGMAFGDNGTSPPIALVESPFDIQIAVRAPTDDPPPEIDFDVEVIR